MIHPGAGNASIGAGNSLRSWLFYYLLSLLISASNFLPLLVESELESQYVPPSTVSYMIVCYLMALPLIFEFILDITVSHFSTTSRNLAEPKVGYFVLLISLFLPVFTVSGDFHDASSPCSVMFINCFMSFLQTLVIIGLYDKLQFRSHGHWKISGCLVSIFLYTSSQVSLNVGIAYTPARLVSLTSVQKACYGLSMAFCVLCLATHGFLAKRYYFSFIDRIFRGIPNAAKNWKVDDYVSIVLQRITFVYFVVNVIASVFFLLRMYDYIYHLNSSVVSHIVLGLCAAILPGRVVRKNFILLNESMAIKETFIRYVSHEIRSPLSTTSLGLNYLLDKLRAHEINLTEVLDVVQESVVTCELAMNTLNDFLMLDKIQNHMLDLNTVSRPATEFMIDAAKSENLILSCNAESCDGVAISDVMVEIDCFKMNQVLRNLLSNAFKFTPSGGTITATMTMREYSSEELLKSDITSTLQHCVDGKCKMVCYSVTDSGCGISAENLPRLFGQYVQFEAAKLQGGKGSGLGLWLSKAIVEMHGGRIGARSEGEGKGCTFWFELPCVIVGDSRSRTISVSNSCANNNFSVSLFSTAQCASQELVTVSRSTPQLEDSSNLVDLERDIEFGGNVVAGTAETSHSSITRFVPRSMGLVPPRIDVSPLVGLPKRFVELQIDIPTSARAAAKYKLSPCVKRTPPGLAASRTSNMAAASQDVSDSIVPLKVLLVDDSNITRKMVERSLASIDAVCTHARTGLEAVEKVQNSMSFDVPYDVILMDHFMPEMSGPEAVEVIRHRLQYKGVIMGVSGNASDTEYESLLSEGKINLMMVKPFNLDLFVSFLNDSKA